jgi:hypothetical protein
MAEDERAPEDRFDEEPVSIGIGKEEEILRWGLCPQTPGI